MERMKKMAVIADTVCHVLQVCCLMAGIAAAVGVLIVAAFFLFDLRPEQVATGYQSLTLGYLNLTIAETAAPDPAKVLANAAVQIGMTGVLAVLAWRYMGCIRKILAPVKNGDPFHGTVCLQTQKLALLTVFLGVVANAQELIGMFLTMRTYNLPALLTGGNITAAQLDMQLDLRFLAVAAVLLLLSYIFRYGQNLQKETDDTGL